VASLWTERRSFRAAEIAARLNGFVALVGLGALTAFYHAWFLVFWLSLVGILACRFSAFRLRTALLLSTARRVLWQPALLAALLLLPFLAVYLPGRSAASGRGWEQTAPYIPSLPDYLRLGPDHLLWGWVPFNAATSGIELRNGLGFCVTATILAGWVWSIRFMLQPRRDNPNEELLAAALGGSLLVTILSTHWGLFYPWHAVFNVVPGASSMLAVGRWVLTWMLPGSILIATFVDRIPWRSGLRPIPVVGCVAIGLGILEQGGRISAEYSAADAVRYHQQVVAAIPPACGAFLLAPPLLDPMIPEEAFDAARYLDDFHYQLSALIGSALSGIPTVNGASGLSPVGYPLSSVFTRDLDDRLTAWLERFPHTQACLVRLSLPPEGLTSSTTSK